MPAYNAGRTLRETYAEIPFDVVDEVILVDDASTDDTVAVARSLGIHTIVHEKNLGYGGNQKTCYATALAHGRISCYTPSIPVYAKAHHCNAYMIKSGSTMWFSVHASSRQKRAAGDASL